MTWMPTFLENRTDVDFTGYDIVPSNIENHKKRFSSTAWNFEVFYPEVEQILINVSVQVHDSVVHSMPKFDLILSRHTMMHLKTNDIAKMLKNFHDSGSTYLLATNFPELEARQI